MIVHLWHKRQLGSLFFPTLSPMLLIETAYININTRYYLSNISSFKAITICHTKILVHVDRLITKSEIYYRIYLPKLFSQFQNKMV